MSAFVLLLSCARRFRNSGIWDYILSSAARAWQALIIRPCHPLNEFAGASLLPVNTLTLTGGRSSFLRLCEFAFRTGRCEAINAFFEAELVSEQALIECR